MGSSTASARTGRTRRRRIERKGDSFSPPQLCFCFFCSKQQQQQATALPPSTTTLILFQSFARARGTCNQKKKRENKQNEGERARENFVDFRGVEFFFFCRNLTDRIVF